MRYDFEKIRKARMLRGWSQTRLAELTGIAVSTVNNVEHGRHGKPSTVRAMADILNIDMRDLLVDDDVAVGART